MRSGCHAGALLSPESAAYSCTNDGTLNMPFCLGGWKPLLRRLPAGQSGVALTYDDGPTPETTPHLLNLLDRAGATATFFLTGERVEAYPQQVAAVVAAGHAVYGHGWHHRNFGSDPAVALSEMKRVEAMLSKFRPTPDPYLIRMPYFAGYNRASTHRAFARFQPNIQFVWWSHTIRDWELPATAQDYRHFIGLCEDSVGRLLAAPDLNGGIVLLHEQPYDIDGPFNVQSACILLPMILDGLAMRGLRPVAIRPAPNHSLLRRFVLLPAP